MLMAGVVAAAGFWLIDTGWRHPGPGGIGGFGLVYRAVVDSVATIVPLIAVAFAVLALKRGPPAGDPRQEQAFAAVGVLVFSAMIAFPFSTDLYFHYIAPLIVIAIVALASVAPQGPEPRIAGATLAFYLAFAVVRVAVSESARLPIPRGGLHVPPADSAEVGAFVEHLRARARNGYTYATPDAPEAYFLTGLKNPTRTMYEFLGDSGASTDQILSALDEHRVTAVAISYWRIFSPRPDRRLLAALRSRYPDSAVVWHFILRWKEERPVPLPDAPSDVAGASPR
jgi:hypothetical protein